MCTTQALALELTVERCVQLGLEQNDNLKAMTAEVEINNQDVKIAYAELFPSISLESSYLLRDQPPHFTLESGLFGSGLPPQDAQVEGDKDHYTVGVKLKQTLFAGGRLLRTHEGKNLLLDAQRYQLEGQKSQIAYQIKRYFYSALSRRYELEASAETVLTQEEELRIRNELLQRGKTTMDEILTTESNLLFAKTERLRAEQAYQGALDDLQAMIGVDGQVSVVEPKFYSTLSPAFEVRNGEVSAKRPDLKRLDAQINAADKNVQVAKSGYFPELNLEASYLNQKETDITEPVIWEAGLRLEWSLFEAGKTNAEVAKASADVLRLKHTRRALERTINNEVNAALRLVREYEALVEAQKLQLIATEQEHTYRTELYREGKLKTVDILSIRAKLATANAKYRVEINNLRTALAALETALSQPLDGELIPHEPYHPDLKSLEETLNTQSKKTTMNTQQKSLAATSDSYAVQLGAFRSKEKASSCLSSLQMKYPDTTFEAITVDGWWKIRTTPFSSQAAAIEALKELEGKGFIVHGSTDS
jgi:outer membrane protein TolC